MPLKLDDHFEGDWIEIVREFKQDSQNSLSFLSVSEMVLLLSIMQILWEQCLNPKV